MNTETKHTAGQLSVGTCPICGKIPTWFNDVPLRAFCWGEEGNEHKQASRIVPSPYQPYGEARNTRWVISRKNLC